MMYQLLYIASEAVNFAIWLSVPGIFLTGVLSRLRQTSKVVRFIASVLVVWGLLVLYRFAVHLHISHKVAESMGRPEWDGVGGNVALLFGGWILGIQSSLAWIIGIWFVTKWRNRRSPQQPPAGDVLKAASEE